MDIEVWKVLFSQKIGGAYNERAYIAAFGVTPEVTQSVWELLMNSELEWKYKREHLLWGLAFLKQYESLDNMSGQFHATPKTFNQWTWRIIKDLFENLDMVREKERKRKRERKKQKKKEKRENMPDIKLKKENGLRKKRSKRCFNKIID